MPEPRVLIADPLDDAGVRRLREAGCHVAYRPKVTAEELPAALAGCHAVIVRSRTGIDRAVLAAADVLGIVARAGSGMDTIDVEACRARGIRVCNTPDTNTRAVAELVIGMFFALARQLAPADRGMRAGRWEKSAFLGTQLYGKRLGILGLGAIGGEVARMAAGLGWQVIANRREVFRVPPELRSLGVEVVPWDECLARADLISVNIPLTERTRGALDARAFARMRRGVILVNASRGGIVDEAALVAALQSGQVAAAGLDVFAQEPPADNPFRAFDQVLMTPHLGAMTREGQYRAALAAAEQVITHLQERGLLGG